ncbi:hypothetical protein HPT29_002225 [Microvirga terrae]|uniref:DUF1998 domain-containing protein n=1 Tax=Microvirga terrae TaxID=2740529 RepID=A0ABY5RRX4_9HYPH|nr:hypothetical protein [Microvirga terrae]UVF19990.1 hypothetical protein HPT29_002225 [Microvirga terrae]
MTNDVFTMTRSRTQIATVYAPESFFTFEGGLGACIARSAAGHEVPKLSLILREQILEAINARVRSWYEQATRPRPQGFPPVEPRLALDKELLRDPHSPGLQPDRVRFVSPEEMHYEPAPLTFVCRECRLIKDYADIGQFEAGKDRICDGCPKKDKGGCKASWEQLDVVLVHWSGSWRPIGVRVNRYDNGEVKWSRMSCTCGNEHFLLNRSAPVFAKWRLECSACGTAQQLPVVADDDSFRLLGEGIRAGANQRVEVNMEPVSYRANSAYYAQGDRVLAFEENRWYEMLRHNRGGDLAAFAAQEYRYPVQVLTDPDIERILKEKNLEREWESYNLRKKTIEFLDRQGEPALADNAREENRRALDRLRDEKILPDAFQATPELLQAVNGIQRAERKFEPLRQAVEHKTLDADVLRDSTKFANVREPKDPIIPDLSTADLEEVKRRIAGQLSLLGIADMRLVTKFPVCEFTFGYTRVESGPRVSRKKTQERWDMPVRLNLFPLARMDREMVQPIYTIRQDNEALYVRLDEDMVKAWLEANSIPFKLPSPNSRLGAALIDAYSAIGGPDRHGFSPWLDEYRNRPGALSRNVYAYVYTLLHTIAHQLIHSVAGVSGLDIGSLSEHLFVPDLAFAVYRRGTTMDLGYIASAWRTATSPGVGNSILSTMLDPDSLRCGSGAICDERGGACPDCVLIPEISCLTRNNLLSRSVLRGMAKPHWDVTLPKQASVKGYYPVVRDVIRMRSATDDRFPVR